jgi:hypothetical protein
VSPELENNILFLWRQFMENQESGSSFFPFYSWLSLYGEIGLVGILFVIIFSIRIISRMRKFSKKVEPFIPMGITLIITYFLMLGFQDNYWEWSQPVFLIVLLTKLCYEYVKIELRNKIWHLNTKLYK